MQQVQPTKTISKVIHINAPESKVWQALFGKANYPRWASFFAEGSDVKTDWQEGSQAIFGDGTDNGLVGRITANREPNFLEIEYEGLITNGQPDYDSEMARTFKGAIENYTLTEQNGVTTLAINSDMSEQFYVEMSAAWDKALTKVKEIAES